MQELTSNFRDDIIEVWVVGAFDRHNYGDLLCPLLVQNAVRSRGFSGSVRFFSTSKSDLSRYGAIPTERLSAMFGDRSAAGVMVVIAGGEVLAATWSTIMGYLYRYPFGQLIKRLSYWVGEPCSAALLSRFLATPSKMPFVYAPQDFMGMPKVVYNAVGGSHLRDSGSEIRKTVAENLRKSSFVSVRDNASKILLNDLQVPNVRVSPDSAVLLSEIYPKSSLRKLASEASIATIDSLSSGGYICFQSAYMYIDGREDLVAESLRRTIECTGLSVLIVAIGLANGHRDDKAARVLKDKLGDHPGVKIISGGMIFDIMLAVSSAKLYAGTSLHGAITALSYGVAQLGLCPDLIPKLAAFIETWSDRRTAAVCEYSRMPDFCHRLMRAPDEVLLSKQAEVIEAATANFDVMFGHTKTPPDRPADS